MAERFSDEWINILKDEWNNEPEVSDALAKIGFSSVITCGYKDDETPKCIFVVENGKAVRAGLYNGEEMDWDMRASEKDWAKWAEKPLNMASMGFAYTTGKIKFPTGDFSTMIKTPAMAGPFVKSFALMAKIPN